MGWGIVRLLLCPFPPARFATYHLSARNCKPCFGLLTYALITRKPCTLPRSQHMLPFTHTHTVACSSFTRAHTYDAPTLRRKPMPKDSNPALRTLQSHNHANSSLTMPFSAPALTPGWARGTRKLDDGAA